MELFSSSSSLRLSKVLLFCCIHLIIFCGLNLQQQAHGCLKSERDGLLRLKAEFNHPNGSSFPSWDLDVNLDCCQWENVTCDSFTKRVIGLSLSHTVTRPLLVPFQKSFWSLNASVLLPFEDLKFLILSQNLIKGLEEFPRLGKLELLDLWVNWFRIMPPVHLMPSLKILNLRSNHMEDSNVLKLLTGLSRFGKLESLDLGSNHLITMPSVHLLPTLKILNLEHNHLSNWDELAAQVTTLKKLEVLDLAFNSFAGKIPSFIGNLVSLKSLSFQGDFDRKAQLTGSFPAQVICRLKNLEELDLSRNSLEGSLPLCLSDLTSLRAIDLAENNLRGSIPSSLFASLNSLEYVSLSSNSFQGSFTFSSLANNSNLEVFELINNNNIIEVDAESPLNWIPLFQLKVLRLSNCTLRNPNSAIPTFLLTQNQLRLLKLDNIGIKGDVFLSSLFENNTSLEVVTLSNNSLQGTFELKPNSHNPHLHWLDVSINHISGEIPLLIGSSLPNLRYLNMSRNALRGPIPHSIGEMRDLYSLDLSHNYLSGEVPASLALYCFNLTFLKLSNNSFHGTFPPLNSNLKRLRTMHLDSNNFTGFTEGVLNSGWLSLLDVSQNALSGKVFDLIANLKSLSTLVLSNNFLEGDLPMSICNMSSLTYLDLSHNYIGPSLPLCLNLTSLVHFHMQNNQLKDHIPYVLSQAKSLVTLDLSHNKLHGEITSWFPSSLPNLRIILLKGNNLDGPIPFSFCKLKNISILDFSNNRFSGSIPFCLGDLLLGRELLFDGTYNGRESVWANYGSLRTYSHTNKLRMSPLVESYYYMLDENDLVHFVTKRRDESYEGNILYYMSGLDLSCNNLEGTISPAIGLLSGIHTLNLSHNYLIGSIPNTFSDLEQIESLDLSHNMLSGEIPTQLLRLNFLSVFSVAYNNLSGATPKMVGQFSTFDASSYEGNLLLHGPPLKTKGNCSSDDNDDCHTQIFNDNQHYFWYSFIGSSVGFFLAVCGCFYLNSYPLETMIVFISVQLSRVPYCANFAKLLKVRRIANIRFVLDN